MLKKLSLTCISFFLLSNFLYAQTNEDQLIDEMVSQVDTEELRLIVEQLSGAMPLDDGSFIDTRRVGTAGNEKGSTFIEEQYSNIGTLDIMQDSFNALRTARVWALLTKLIVLPTLPPEKGEELLATIQETLDFIRNNNIRRCENIIAVLRGETRQSVFTTAHYDAMVSHLEPPIDLIIEDALAPGADDNATGVAATIVAARILSQYLFTNNICFMNTDAEDLGMFGSMSYVLQHRLASKQIKSLLNIDMIGYDHDSDGIMNVPYGSDPMKDVVSKEYDRLGLNIAPVFLSIDTLMSQSEHSPMASDHFPFYLFGGVDNVVSFGETFWLSESEFASNETNPNFHTEEDTVDNINLPYLTEIVKLYVATLAREAGVIGRR
jgi:hypothetical protein